MLKRAAKEGFHGNNEKTERVKNETHKNTTTVVIALLTLNVLLLAYVAFFKHDTIRLETMKVGGVENFKFVQLLYNSDTYRTQQTQAIQQVLASMNQALNQ